MPDQATNKALLWTSSKPDVATVDNTGLVTAHAWGQAIITVITVDGGKTASCLVNVSESGRANVNPFNAAPGNGKINLSWTNPAAADYHHASISWSPGGGTATVNKGDPPNYTINGLTNGTTYTVEIIAYYDDATFSGTSSKAVVPAAPVTDLSLDSFAPTPGLIADGGATPKIAATVSSPSSITPEITSQFERVDIDWLKADGTTPHSGSFYAGTVYKVKLTIKAKPAFTFAGAPWPSPSPFPSNGPFTYGSLSAGDIKTTISSDYKTATVILTFPATAGVTVSGKITSGDFPGGLEGASVQLKNGAVNYLTPATTASDGTYTISGVAAGTYTTVVSKASYSSVTISSFTITTTGVSNNNTVLLFTVTAPFNLTAPLIAVPVAGMTRPTAIAPQTQYTGTISWNPNPPSPYIFAEGTAYTATLTLNAATGYTFLGLGANAFTHSGASSIISPAGTGTSLTVTIAFPAAQKLTVPLNASDHGGLVGVLNYIKTQSVRYTNYVVTVNSYVSMGPYVLNAIADDGLATVSITLRANASTVIALNSYGSLFTLEGQSTAAQVTLALGENITLQGLGSNNASLVRVNNYANLIMSDNAAITENRGSYGGGVYVYSGGSFTMSGGTISNNTSSGYGGGVYVSGNGSFTMSGGTISNNNTPGSNNYGGGVYNSGSFTMSGGTISNNNTSGSGSSGGGVYNGGSFTMSGGTISNNTTPGYGGGVCGNFIMTGGTISGNTAGTGGGVYTGVSFSKTGGTTIYGDSDTTHTSGSTENTATSGNGHAVYMESGPRKRNSTAGPGVNLSDTIYTKPPWED